MLQGKEVHSACRVVAGRWTKNPILFEKNSHWMLHCPRCKSKDIHPVLGGYAGSLYRCKKCGYRGPLVLEYDEEDFPGNNKPEEEEG